MARRKAKKKSYRRRSRRMGAMGGGKLMDAVAVIGGAAAASLLAQKLFPTMDEKLKNVAIAGLGIYLVPKLIKGSTGAALGYGMVAAGGVGLLKNFGVINGVEDTLEIPVSVSGMDDNISVISGDDNVMTGDDLAVMSGDEEEGYY
jgi:hypothetical protein